MWRKVLLIAVIVTATVLLIVQTVIVSPTSSSSESSQSTQSEPPPTINHNCNCDQATIYSALDTEKEVVLNNEGYQFISLSYKPTPTLCYKVNHKPPDERTTDADRVRIRNAKRKLSY